MADTAPTVPTASNNHLQHILAGSAPTYSAVLTAPAPTMEGDGVCDILGSITPNPGIPLEIQDHIRGYACASAGCPPARASWDSTMSHPAAKPPSDGSSPFLSLPSEIRKEIFLSSLPARDAIIRPTCGSRAHFRASGRKPLWNRTSTLMSICKTVKDELAEIVYEERTFQIHVHQDLDNGGIEFLDAGRQPLQYQNNICDDRFARFGNNEEFGFSRVKKVHVAIFPASGDAKHCATSAYYMNLALVKLLERDEGDKNRINRITISFSNGEASTEQASRRAIMRREHFWWDPDSKEPRSTSVYGISDIELVLRPFANLRTHNSHIFLPSELDSHPGTCHFVAKLKRCMEIGALMEADEFEDRMDRQRNAFEDYLFNRKYGTNAVSDYKWTDRDWDEEEKDTPKRRKTVEDIDEMDDDTQVFLDEQEDIEGQSFLLQQQKFLLKKIEEKNNLPKAKTDRFVGRRRRLNDDGGAASSSGGLLASLAAARHSRGMPRDT